MSSLTETATPAHPVAERSDGQRSTSDVPVTVIEPRSGWRLIDLKELRDYRDLFYFLVWRDIKGRYAQSAIGIGWAIMQPLLTMGIFTIIFGNLAQISSDGVPYAIFSFAALAPWTYFQSALTSGADSLVRNAGIISKIYFPRIILPISAVLAKLVDFGIALVLLAVLMVVFGAVPNAGLVMLPFLILLMIVSAAGLGMWLTALAIQYRDVSHAITFGVRMLMYLSPVVYPASLIPARYELGGFTVNLQLFYALNPMVGVIEGFRAALLGTRPMPWAFIGLGTVTASVVLLTGMLYFRRRERLFADVA